MFKVGDRVRCTQDDLVPFFTKNEIITIESSDEDMIYGRGDYNYGNQSWTISTKQVELVEQKKELKKQVELVEQKKELKKQTESAKNATTMTVKPILHANYTLVIKDQKINLTKSELYDLMEVVKGELNES